jgi:hypothetical protein
LDHCFAEISSLRDMMGTFQSSTLHNKEHARINSCWCLEYKFGALPINLGIPWSASRTWHEKFSLHVIDVRHQRC